MERLTRKEAFQTMTLFLDDVYQRTRSDFLGGMLGDMQFLDNNKPADEAVWYQWLELIPSEQLTNKEAFEAAGKFLKLYFPYIGKTDEYVVEVVDSFRMEQGEPTDEETWRKWLDFIAVPAEIKNQQTSFYTK